MNYNENLKSSASQNAQIANWLLGGHTLTSLEALEKFGCMRLASRIHDLRERGLDIQAERVTTTSGKSVTQYSVGVVSITYMAELMKQKPMTIRVSRTDAVRQFFTGDDITMVIESYPLEYRADLVGWRKAEGCYWYEPIFSTKQAEWDESVKKYINAKGEWCARHTDE